MKFKHPILNKIVEVERDILEAYIQEGRANTYTEAYDLHVKEEHNLKRFING